MFSRTDEMLGSAVHVLPTMVFQSGNTSLSLKQPVVIIHNTRFNLCPFFSFGFSRPANAHASLKFYGVPRYVLGR